jgi:hypothetical protein
MIETLQMLLDAWNQLSPTQLYLTGTVRVQNSQVQGGLWPILKKKSCYPCPQLRIAK